MGPSQQELIHSYRQLYKHLLSAVRYSKPARFIARDRLRAEFQYGDPSMYDQLRISRTLEFLTAASKSTGLEHRIVKNLMHVWWEQQAFQRKTMTREAMALRKAAFQDFGHTIRMLEQTMGMYIGDSVMLPNYFDSDGPFPE